MDKCEKCDLCLWSQGSGGGGGGSGSGVMVVHQDDNTLALDKTWQEIHDAFAAAKIIVIQLPADEYGAGIQLPMFTGYDAVDENYFVSDLQNNFKYIAQTLDGYPVAD